MLLKHCFTCSSPVCLAPLKSGTYRCISCRPEHWFTTSSFAESRQSSLQTAAVSYPVHGRQNKQPIRGSLKRTLSRWALFLGLQRQAVREPWVFYVCTFQPYAIHASDMPFLACLFPHLSSLQSRKSAIQVSCNLPTTGYLEPRLMICR